MRRGFCGLLDQQRQAAHRRLAACSMRCSGLGLARGAEPHAVDLSLISRVLLPS